MPGYTWSLTLGTGEARQPRQGHRDVSLLVMHPPLWDGPAGTGSMPFSLPTAPFLTCGSDGLEATARIEHDHTVAERWLVVRSALRFIIEPPGAGARSPHTECWRLPIPRHRLPVIYR
jgi:hypothetical protein